MKQSKIEKYNLVDIVRKGIKAGKSSRIIAIECSAIAPEQISHNAVNAYIKYLKESDKHVRKDVVQRNRSVQLGLIKQDMDIIALQYRTTSALLERFDMIDTLPDTFEKRMAALEAQEEMNPEYLKAWAKDFSDDLKRNVQNIAILNRELRENSKFMSELREKAFEFNLVQEFIYLFMEEFKKVNPEAYEIANQKIAANPRLQRIVEQQDQMRGGNVE